MALTFRGLDISTPVAIRYSEGRRNSDGTMETDVLFAVATANLMTNLPERGVSVHPHWENFKADLFTWTTPLQGVTLLRVFYIAVIETTLTPGSPLPLDVEEEASNTTSEEPITTLTNFLEPKEVEGETLDAITAPENGAWPTKDFGDGPVPVTVGDDGRFPRNETNDVLIPGNGAIFDTYGQNKNPAAADYNPNVGRFLYFAPGSPFVGLEAYVIPRGEWAFSYSQATQPNLSDAGKIGTPPGLPDPEAPVNYLCAAMRYRRSGFVYRVQQHWRRSGPRGWNPKIYPAIT